VVHLQVEALLEEKQQLLQSQEALQTELGDLVTARSVLQGQLGKRLQLEPLAQLPLHNSRSN
jgi:hypothetical protein